MDGAEAERCAEEFLKRHNLVLLERNYRCRFGEIDLVMRDGITLVFVEVRMRASSKFGGAGASITSEKKQKLLRTARHYLTFLRGEPPCRFDAVLLSNSMEASVEWIRDAFGE